MAKNRHGLQRDIPEGVKRAVRQRDGFGCVVCGNALVDYDHFDPDFADATSHLEGGIVLLCIMCHGRKTRGQLSSETIRDALKEPKAKQLGFSFGPFDLGKQQPEVAIGNIIARNVRTILKIEGEDILSVKAPEQEGGPFRISAFLRDRTGSPMLEIVDNEWRTSTANWDATIKGQRIVIHSQPGNVSLHLRADPPHRLTVERLHMRYRDIEIHCREGAPTTLTLADGTHLRTQSMELADNDVGISLMRDGSLTMGSGGGSVKFNSVTFSWLPQR